MREADGGGVILIDPQTLRRCATTLDDLAIDYGLYASSLSGMPMPLMPVPVIGTVEEGIAQATAILQSQHVLHDDAVELRSRALWTDFADAYADGYALSGSELRLFVAGLENGTLMQYAEPWQAELAGEWVGKTYSKTFASNPAKLVELSRILAGSARDSTFSVAFVHQFGGANLVKVPRVLQAMVYTYRLSPLDSQLDGFANTELAAELGAEGYTLKQDPQNLLASFALALAVASSASDMSRKSSGLANEEDAIARSPDSWAVAQLLTNQGMYGRRFLNQVFQHQLIPLVQRDTIDRMVNATGFSTLPIVEGGQNDPKQIILNALARNPVAAADALTTKLDQPLRFASPYGPVESNDPMEILYHAYWSDHGQGFANMYSAAVDHLEGANVTQGNTLTMSAIQQVLHGPQDLTPMTRALASDLAQHQMPSLYDAAASATGGDAVWLASDHGNHLDMGARALRDLMVKFNGDPQAGATFNNAAAAEQAKIILANTRTMPTSGNMGWVNKVAAFNTIVMDAHGLELHDRFDASNESHKLAFDFLGAVSDDLAKAVPGGEFVVGPALDWLDGHTAPSATALVAETGDANAVTINSLYASIAHGYYSNGVIHTETVPSILKVEPSDPHSPLKPYQSLRTNDEIGEYNYWMHTSPAVLTVTNEVNQTVGAQLEQVNSALGN